MDQRRSDRTRLIRHRIQRKLRKKNRRPHNIRKKPSNLAHQRKRRTRAQRLPRRPFQTRNGNTIHNCRTRQTKRQRRNLELSNLPKQSTRKCGANPSKFKFDDIVKLDLLHLLL